MSGVPERPTIVIVDDHPSFRRVARDLLHARGFAVVGEAEHAAAAQEVVGRTAPDAVLLDVGLGEESGFAVARALTRSHPRLAVLLTSADPDRGEVEGARASGARGFLPKDRLADADLAALWAT